MVNPAIPIFQKDKEARENGEANSNLCRPAMSSRNVIYDDDTDDGVTSQGEE
jgi:hypothetical protein